MEHITVTKLVYNVRARRNIERKKRALKIRSWIDGTIIVLSLITIAHLVVRMIG